MKKVMLCAAAIGLVSLSAIAHANLSIETVAISNAGNVADTTGYGSVAYNYNIGKYEVTAGQYTAFLNAKANVSDTYGLYKASNIHMHRTGSAGSYSYRVDSEYTNHPIGGVAVLKNAAEKKNVPKAISNVINAMYSAVHDAMPGVYTNTPMMLCPESLAEFVADHAKLLQTNILGLFAARTFVRDGEKIMYASQPKLPKDKVIVLSATADEELYKKAFPDRNIQAIRLDNVEMVGNIQQCTQHSLSRQSLNNMTAKRKEAIFNGITERIGDVPVITYKHLKKDLDAFGIQATELMHFGKCTGYDNLKGQNMAVVGTPNLNPLVYMLIASVLGMFVTAADQLNTMVYSPIEYNNNRFYFPAYSNSDLRRIQLWLVSSNITQAVHRARPLRTPVTVYVFSSLPVQGAEFFKLAA